MLVDLGLIKIGKRKKMNYNTDDILLSLGKLHFDMSQAQRYIVLLQEEIKEKDQKIQKLQSSNNQDKDE